MTEELRKNGRGGRSYGHTDRWTDRKEWKETEGDRERSAGSKPVTEAGDSEKLSFAYAGKRRNTWPWLGQGMLPGQPQEETGLTREWVRWRRRIQGKGRTRGGGSCCVRTAPAGPRPSTPIFIDASLPVLLNWICSRENS